MEWYIYMEWCTEWFTKWYAQVGWTVLGVFAAMYFLYNAFGIYESARNELETQQQQDTRFSTVVSQPDGHENARNELTQQQLYELTQLTRNELEAQQQQDTPFSAVASRCPLVEKVLQRQGRCRILDLGSGWVDGYGYFNRVEAYRAAGYDVTLTAVDVIFPPLFGPDNWTMKPRNSPAELARLQELTNHGVECVGQEITAFLRDAWTDYKTWYLEHDADGRSSPRRFDIIHLANVYGQDTVPDKNIVTPEPFEIAALLNPGGFYYLPMREKIFWMIQRDTYTDRNPDIYGHRLAHDIFPECPMRLQKECRESLIHHLKQAERLAEYMRCKKARLIIYDSQGKHALVVQKVDLGVWEPLDVDLAKDFHDFD